MAYGLHRDQPPAWSLTYNRVVTISKDALSVVFFIELLRGSFLDPVFEKRLFQNFDKFYEKKNSQKPNFEEKFRSTKINPCLSARIRSSNQVAAKRTGAHSKKKEKSLKFSKLKNIQTARSRNYRNWKMHLKIASMPVKNLEKLKNNFIFKKYKNSRQIIFR